MPDALAAAAIFAADPAHTGVLLRAGPGRAREQWLACLRALWPAPAPLRRVPAGVPDDRLLGGLDLVATLAAGRPIAERGILAGSDGGALLLVMSERLPPATAERIAVAMDAGEVVVQRDGIDLRLPARFGVVALDEGLGEDERTPRALADRLAIHLGLAADTLPSAIPAAAVAEARARLDTVATDAATVHAVCAVAAALGIASLRAPLLALRVARAAAALARLHERLDRAYAGRPVPIAADRAFAEAVARHDIPRALPEALLEGFLWDAEARRYRDLASLHAYAARVAGTVGAMMALLMGARDRHALARACDLGIAMQLTNIARDVGEDARAGRLYLPLDWLSASGIDPDAFLARPRFTPALGAVVARLLAEADRLYRRAESGIALLPAPCRPGIGAARLIYAEIGRSVARQSWDSLSRRAVVPTRRRLALLAASVARAASWPDAARADPPVAAARFLVEAAAGAAHRAVAANDLDARIAWLVDLYDRLERRDRSPRLAAVRASR